MNTNYKELAKKYKYECELLNEILREGAASRLSVIESIREKDREIEKWKAKYFEAMAELIEMQERIWMQGDTATTSEKDGWISVDDRLPEDNEWVLVSMRSKVTGKRRRIHCCIRNAGVWQGEIGETLGSEITHWMPPPEPPIEGGPND